MKIQLSSSELQVGIYTKGAEVFSVQNNEGLEFMWQANPLYWPRHAPVLFPIVGRLKDNTYFIDQKKYTLPQHGFARDAFFEPVLMSASSCTFQLKAQDSMVDQYPFDFVFEITHRLEGDTLHTQYTVINPTSKTLYFSVGAHPAFNWPINPTEKAEDYYLAFEGSSYTLSLLQDGLRSGHTKPLDLEGGRLPLHHALFDQDALVFEHSQIQAVSLCSSKSKHRVEMRCDNWPYFGIWSKKGPAPFVCLEPWYGIADSVKSTQQLAEKQGLIALPGFDRFECAMSVRFV